MKLGLICQHAGLETAGEAEARWTIPPAGDAELPWTPLPPSVAVDVPPPPASGPRLVTRRPPAKVRKPSQRPARTTVRPAAA